MYTHVQGIGQCPETLTGPSAIFLYSVADQREPKDRMIALLKWYLSSFHSGKQVSSVIIVLDIPLLEIIMLSYTCNSTS